VSGTRPEAMAAAVIDKCRAELAQRGSNVVREAIAPAATIAAWRHYPEGEVYDPASHAQYFYHRHSAGRQAQGEHGHFHLFLRAEGIPPGITPLLLPEIAVANVVVAPQAPPLKRGVRDEVCHLAAIAVDPRGEPTRLFTTNRWVTGETWYRAEDVIRLLDHFTIAAERPPIVLNRWLIAMVRLFRPQLAGLLQARDETVMAWRRRRRVHVFDDTRLEITSSLDIDLDAHLAAVRERSAEPGGAGRRRAPRLPRMAEGWVEEGGAD
jgi:Domain of unknown function (DUF6969)